MSYMYTRSRPIRIGMSRLDGEDRMKSHMKHLVRKASQSGDVPKCKCVHNNNNNDNNDSSASILLTAS
jgi:hypothetical protein